MSNSRIPERKEIVTSDVTYQLPSFDYYVHYTLLKWHTVP